MKTHKFTASVVMPCNREQFEELRPELEKIGYKSLYIEGRYVECVVINNLYDLGAFSPHKICSHEYINSIHKLKEYNKALFLDLARCNDSIKGIAGERCICIKSCGLYVEGFLYEFGDLFIFQNEELFRKANPEEIIEWHYSKDNSKEQLYEIKPELKDYFILRSEKVSGTIEWWKEKYVINESGLQPVEEKKKYTIVFNSSDDLVLIDNDTEEDISFTEPQRDAIEWFLNTFGDNPKEDFKKSVQSFKMHVLECADRGEASKSIEEFFNM